MWKQFTLRTFKTVVATNLVVWSSYAVTRIVLRFGFDERCMSDFDIECGSAVADFLSVTFIIVVVPVFVLSQAAIPILLGSSIMWLRESRKQRPQPEVARVQ